MHEISQTRIEDAIANTTDFLYRERGTEIDGGFAAAQIDTRVETVAERAQELLLSTPHPRFDGLYVPLSSQNAYRFDEASAVLPGYFVLVPSALVDRGTSVFYPAVVSEDGARQAQIRLHVLRQPYRQQIRHGAGMALSAAGQSETSGIGAHNVTRSDGVEAEHFATLLAAGTDPRIRSAWQSGNHVNHHWRNRADTSVTTELSQRLFSDDIPQTTLTLSRQQFASGEAMLLWHSGMWDEAAGRPETATQDKALVVIQGLGFEALRAHNPRGLDVVKELIS